MREVLCLFGLPFDVITMDEVMQRIRTAVQTRQRLFLSTPNLNFLVACQTDATFRQSVIDSDLSVADGFPLVWISRWLGAPLPERVAGSSLFERLRDAPLMPGDRPIRVYFFGGPPGAAEAAGRSLNSRPCGMVCVGFESPGFGSIEAISRQDILDHINASDADFLVVALGATKGQAWIQRNRAHLRTPVISHLGAGVNFAAGTVRRAPGWVQRIGLEWLWRIKEEPGLWRRYWRDALALSGYLFSRLLPYRLWLLRHRPAGEADFEVRLRQDAEVCRILLKGAIPEPVPAQLQAALQQACDAAGPVVLDLGRVEFFGPGFAGLLILFKNNLAANKQPLEIIPSSPRMQQLFFWNGLSDLLHP